jgi:predicted nucleotidyltransferase
MTTCPNWIPAPFRPLVQATIAAARADPRLVGLALGGSAAAGVMDEYSDLDFVVVVRDEHHRDLLHEAPAFAAKLGPLLSAFTGEHVREPRLLLCLYGPPLLRMDLLFVADQDLDHRVEDGRILWQRAGALEAALWRAPAVWPRADPQWIEDRFRIWLHNGTTKAGRGEFFACVEQLAFLRRTVFGPLIAQRRGHHPDGVRRIELIAPELVAAMAGTIGDNTATGCLQALRAAVDLYHRLRDETPGVTWRTGAEAATLAYLAAIEARLASGESEERRFPGG